MARYIYTREATGIDGRHVMDGYLESSPEEDKMDMVEDQMMVGFTGNGYLAFWKRCKEQELSQAANRARSVITDTYTDEEKIW
ncbi:hypothetical protein BHK98_09210 [Hornefia porci]|uniref:Uncharacterized protein n=1 Tax=Hornefia porci TaxID=2652292 RepID=A0A1Q9JJ46_9FIRM|nr:hypothetical protein [Hornefia porci]OLR56226.1 hypothetical protein BHK98_09210 [Hornefia porci]